MVINSSCLTDKKELAILGKTATGILTLCIPSPFVIVIVVMVAVVVAVVGSWSGPR
ncbi:hypothetical protein Tco_1173036, partial [Tanacetum coccineum]